MRKHTIIRIVCDVFIAVFLFGFVLSLLWYMNGSLELMPTEEQDGKAKIAACLLMAVFGISSIVCAAVRIKIQKK